MKGATTIQERLWELRKDKGLNLEELSELTGISKSALGSYEKEDYKEINHGNLITLADFYGVSVDYLLCRTENREQINTPLTELHLNDEMVALLKSGRINNRLLCELATHKDFIKFLADIEIYVDGIATMQIQNLNALVDTVRHEIIERYRPGEDDPHLKVLQAAHISDDEYFSHMVLDDLNLIIRDIREAHKKDSESAPQTTVADELKENLEAVENFKGSRLEKLAMLYCKQLGINYKNLSEEEFRWLIRILQKSNVADGLFCREIDGLFCRSSPDIIVRRRCVLSHKRRGWLQPSPSFRYSRNLALQDELYHPVINNGPAVLVCVDKRLGTGPVNQSRDAG